MWVDAYDHQTNGLEAAQFADRPYTHWVQELFPRTDTIIGAGSSDEVAQAVLEEHDRQHSDRPWLFVNMVASIDGATATDGTSGGLGSDGDRAVFRGLRGCADVILVGARTVREENYKPPQAYDWAESLRTERGQADRPRLAVVTGSLNLPADLPFLTDDPAPVIFHPPGVDPDRVAALSERAELVAVGQQASGSEPAKVPLDAVVEDLGRRGATRILSEGGPTINGQLVDAGLIDEWNLTLAPLVVGGPSPRAAVGPLAEGPPVGMTLRRVWTEDGYLFCRWVR